jgi:hypothetical protein
MPAEVLALAHADGAPACGITYTGAGSATPHRGGRDRPHCLGRHGLCPLPVARERGCPYRPNRYSQYYESSITRDTYTPKAV